MMQTRLRNDLQIFILSGFILMGLFSELDRLPVVSTLLFILLISLPLLLPNNSKETKTKKKILQIERPPFHWQNLMIGLVILLPSWILWTRQWNAEFPFSGDHDHHVFAARAGLAYWKSLFWVPLLWGGLIFFIVKKQAPRFWSLAVFFLLFLISLSFKVPDYYFSRYPAFSYLLDAPLMALLESLRWPNLIFANQTTQWLSLPFYLFVLRPFFLKRWPDLKLLLFATLFYWQKDFVHYQSAAYLEPWSLVFIALAIEMTLKPSEHRWMPVLMVGVASWLKETSIIFLPFVWLAVYGPLLRKKNQGHFKEALLTGMASVAPFLAYYTMRVQDKIFRGVGFADQEKIFTLERMQEFLFRIFEQWQASGLVLLILLAFAWVWWFQHNKEQRFSQLCLLFAGLFPFPFYFMDAIALDFPGYPRFYLPAFMFLASPLLVWPESPSLQTKRLLQAFAIILICNSLALFAYMRNSFGESASRSFTEHYDSPAYFPLRTLVHQAQAQGLLSAGEKIAILPSIANFYPQSFAVGYGDLGEKFKFAVAQMPDNSQACHCSGEFKALLVPLLTNSGLKVRKSVPSAVQIKANACIEQIRRSCQNVFEQKLPDGQISGVLGVNTK